MFKIFKYLRARDLWLVLAGLALIVCQVWLDLKLPEYMGGITKLVETEGSDIGQIWAAGGSMLLCAFGSLTAAVLVGFFMAKIAASFSMRLREKLFDKTLSFSMAEMNHFSISSLITRSTNDITQIQMLITMGMAAIVKAPILAIWALLKVTSKSWEFSAATGVAIAFIAIVVAVIIVFALPKYKKIQRLTDGLNRVTSENLTGLRVVRAFHAEDYQEEKFEKVNSKLTNTNLFAARIMAIMQPSMTIVVSGLSLAIYWIGAYLIQSAGGMDKMNNFTDMVVFSSYAVQIVMAFLMLSLVFFMLPRVSVSAKRINEVLDMPLVIEDGSVSDGLSDAKAAIEFRNVSFRYPDAEDYVLKNINFEVNKGETVAFIGATGSGKSTLVNLIPRLYDTSTGEVLVDGVNVKEYALERLNDKLGYVSQQAVLFSGTIASNVAYGGDAEPTEQQGEIQSSLDIAQAMEFVGQMEGGIEAQVARGGTNVSGGQKQRLSIARAIFKKPEILIFDDSFSALDYKTDKMLRNALANRAGTATVLIVAQRIGTIMDADKIIVLDDGAIVGMGTHSELLDSCRIYQEIASSQLTKEELKNGQK